jgi:glycosyltransferase involved in cell wall biosynthesis
VYDDASSDATWERLQALAAGEPRLRVFRQQRNQGVGNHNAALAAARGDFIAWCSDDDRYLPGHLQASVDYLLAHPQVGMVQSSFIDAVEAGTSEFRAPRPLRSASPILIDRQRLAAYMVRYYDWPFHPSSIVMRRSVLEDVGSFDLRFALADTDWFVRVAERHRIALLARHGVLNRRHAGNWSNRVGSARMQAEIFTILEHSFDRMWPGASPRKTFWRFVWRWNVRARLLLTIRARLRTGHLEAARAGWAVLLNETGRPGSWAGLKPAIERLGSLAIAWLAGHSRGFRGPRESVSPL